METYVPKNKEEKKAPVRNKQTKHKTPLDYIRLVGKYALNHF